MSLELVSPRQGEWIHQQAFSPTVDVWVPGRQGWEEKLFVHLSWSSEDFIDLEFGDWEVRWVDTEFYSRPFPHSLKIFQQSNGSNGASLQQLVKSSVSVRILPPDRNDLMHQDSQASIRALLVDKTCSFSEDPETRVLNKTRGDKRSEGCVLLEVEASFRLLSRWASFLDAHRDNPLLGEAILDYPARSGRVWPPAGILVMKQQHENHVDLRILLIGRDSENGFLHVLVNSSSYANISAWEVSHVGSREQPGYQLELDELPAGRHCFLLEHMLDEQRRFATPSHSLCLDLPPSPRSSSTNPDSREDHKACSVEGDGKCRDSKRRDATRTLLVSWMPPVHHVTGMSERLYQVVAMLKSMGHQVSLVSQQCSAFSGEELSHGLSSFVDFRACGAALNPSVATRVLMEVNPRFVLVASWWFGHPHHRSLPEVWYPLVRDFAPKAALVMLVDDLFLPFPYHYNSTVSAAETALVGICGAQTIVFSACDGIGTLTYEDSQSIRQFLPHPELPIRRVRYTTSSDPISISTPSHEERMAMRQLLYIGSCHAANEVKRLLHRGGGSDQLYARRHSNGCCIKRCPSSSDDQRGRGKG
uniref:Uncharacterized protein n=1 Tax=Guillardia theta TaxID=55529 RepID=A0A6U5XZ81_GUITH|mmetsp:Transcript_19573/g.65003  ORF Transcript_19573/g.65003 Transcript_19573/m.65003 type:complete len:588 (+) Transcript_19573:901-2664(+)